VLLSKLLCVYSTQYVAFWRDNLKHARENRPPFTLLATKLNTKHAWGFHLETQNLKKKPKTNKQPPHTTKA